MNNQDNAGVVAVLFLALVAVTFIFILGMTDRTQESDTTDVAEVEDPAPTEDPTPEPEVVVIMDTEPEGYIQFDIDSGESLFQGVCVGCHGLDAVGVPGLGKDLVVNDFVNNLSDEELRDFIIVGRDAFDPVNEVGIAMPARGGSSYSDAEIMQIVAYLRYLADPSVAIPVEGVDVVEADAAEAEEATEPEAAEEVEATDPEEAEVDAGPNIFEVIAAEPRTPRVFDPGKTYAISCSGCHGAMGEGVPLLASNMLENEILDPANRDDLFTFIVNGDPFADPVSSIPHPVRGGYPELNDDEIDVLIGHLQVMAGYDRFPFNPEKAYAINCSGCHGPNGEGVEALTRNIYESVFMAPAERDTLFAFIVEGGPYSDPALNTMPHPVRGEYPALSDDEINALIDYLYDAAP